MPGKVEPRNLAPFLRWVRNVLLGRTYKNNLRFEDYVAARTQPHPNLPGGPSHKLSANYYCNRDGRRESTPATIVFDNSRTKRLPSGSTPGGESQPGKRQFTAPGQPYTEWKLETEERHQ